jgi:hypothetical protein
MLFLSNETKIGFRSRVAETYNRDGYHSRFSGNHKLGGVDPTEDRQLFVSVIDGHGQRK